MLVKLPEEVAAIYDAVRSLENRFPDRKFTPDGHLVGSIGEVIAAEQLGLKLLPASTPSHDAVDAGGVHVQIKLTSTRGISMNSDCERLVVMRIVDKKYVEFVYDGDGNPVWNLAGKMQKNGQRRVSFTKMSTLEGWLVE